MGLFRARNKGIYNDAYISQFSHSQQAKIWKNCHLGKSHILPQRLNSLFFFKDNFFSNRILIIQPLRGAFFVALFSILAYCSYTIFAFKLKYPFIYFFIPKVYGGITLEEYALSNKKGEYQDRINSGAYGRNQMMWDFGLNPVSFDNDTVIKAKIAEIDSTFDFGWLMDL